MALQQSKRLAGEGTEDSPKKARQISGRTVIAHISDLHLDSASRTDKGIWEALRQSLKEQCGRVDLLVVSGDLVELPAWGSKKVFERAKKYLLELSKVLDIDSGNRLLVVPGNHDVRWLRGSLRHRSKALENFKEVFKEQMPAYRFFRPLKLFAFLFDSNPKGFWPDLAAGFVEGDELVRLRKLVQEIRKDFPQEWQEAARIAVVHHHPMPIAATQVEARKLIGGEPYMLLKNASVFMTEVLRSDLELVLHGHRHYPAVSRAHFQEGGSLNRALTVVGAGSVGKEDDCKRSYGVLTLEDSGEVTLQEYRLEAATYSALKPARRLITYEESRPARIRRLLEKKAPPLRVGRYSCHWSIQAGSGDVDIRWTVEQAQAFGEIPVPSIRREFTSRSGYVQPPVYSCESATQEVGFQPGNSPSNGLVEYKPSVGEDPISYSAEIQVFNAFHFNQRDRLDATAEKSDREYVSAGAAQCCETLALSVAFPERHFPRSFQARVRRPNPAGGMIPAETESKYAARFLTLAIRNCVATLVVPKPLPGYRYEISWALPKSEFDETELEANVKKHAEEIRHRLRERGSRQKVRNALSGLKESLERIDECEQELDAAVFVYRAGRLHPVVSVGSDSFLKGLVGRSVGVGQTHVGQAHRRREIQTGVRHEMATDAEFYFDAERDPGVLVEGKEAWLAVPLMYPISKQLSVGLRVAVVWCGTDSRLSVLNCLEDKATGGKIQKAWGKAILSWYGNTLLPALGLEPALELEVDGKEGKQVRSE